MIDYKHWYQTIKGMQEQKSGVLTDDADFYGLKFQDYFILNRVLYHSRPKNIGWIGGFSNLDFFLSQHKVDSIVQCTNVDHTPVAGWCNTKHKAYIEKYQYKGIYKFIEEKYESNMLTDVDFLCSLTPPLSDIKFDNFSNLETLVVYHYGSPKFINMVKPQYKSMKQRIVTNDIVVYSKSKLNLVVEDCHFLTKIRKSEIGNTPNGIFVDETKKMSWNDRISGLTSHYNLTK